LLLWVIWLELALRFDDQYKVAMFMAENLVWTKSTT